MDNDRRRLPGWAFPVLALALAACASEPIDPSAESAFLQDQLIPRMIEWGKGKSDVLPLGPVLASQGFEQICTVAEYERLSTVEREIPEIESYRGSVGEMVPETRIAVIGIKGNTAHVGYLRHTLMALKNQLPRCSSAGKATLRRLPKGNTNPTGNRSYAILEDAE